MMSERYVRPHQHEEGEITEAIEHYTSMVPSGTYLSVAIGCIGIIGGPRLLGSTMRSSSAGADVLILDPTTRW